MLKTGLTIVDVTYSNLENALIRIWSGGRREKIVIAALQIQEIGIALKVLQFCQAFVDLLLVEVRRP